MNSQYTTGPGARPVSPGGRALLAILAVAYAVSAFAAPVAHVLEVQEGPALVVLHEVPAASNPGELPPDPLHDDHECLTCAFLALSGDAPPASSLALAPAVTAPAVAAPASPVRATEAGPPPRLRGPPTT